MTRRKKIAVAAIALVVGMLVFYVTYTERRKTQEEFESIKQQVGAVGFAREANTVRR